ncbi:hypothetical protein mRhiFer1_008126 [Rhinolophus ferrumequinum]|uniref:Uncharacterized protein n=1 Tax=Rhinolophus ferrumequinum TaxID=59479 RepID=A0A7J7W7S9_RHIFE|nr:hypothetical protein mRhiFer1_008126 [Rhinolophus ferrumequinum]
MQSLWSCSLPVDSEYGEAKKEHQWSHREGSHTTIFSMAAGRAREANIRQYPNKGSSCTTVSLMARQDTGSKHPPVLLHCGQKLQVLPNLGVRDDLDCTGIFHRGLSKRFFLGLQVPHPGCLSKHFPAHTAAVIFAFSGLCSLENCPRLSTPPWGSSSLEAARLFLYWSENCRKFSHPSMGVPLMRTAATGHHSVCGGHMSSCPGADDFIT